MYTKANLAALRVKKDIAELSQHRLNATHASTSIDFPYGTRNLLKLKVGVSMTAGSYEGATFHFMLTIPPSYPFHAPTVACTTRAWHPNIDLHTGLVSLPILSKDWRPVLSINTVVFALQLMFIEPTEHSPVNEDAATALKTNPALFRDQVLRSLSGGSMFGVQFESQRQGGGDGKGGGPGAAQKRKRGCGDGMDTEAVQTTLEAMRIQGDESAGTASSSSLTWDKRPRHEQLQPPLQQQQQQQQQQGEYLSAMGPERHFQRLGAAPKPPQGVAVGGHQQQQHQQQQQPQHWVTFGEPNALGAAAVGPHGVPQHQTFHLQQQQQQQPFQQPVHASSAGGGGGGGGMNYLGGGTAFDRLRSHALEEARRSAAAATSPATPVAAQAAAPPPAGLRCGAVGGGVGVGVGPPASIAVPQAAAAGVMGEGVGATAPWGAGQQFRVQAVPTSRLQ